MIRGDVRAKIRDVFNLFEYQPLRSYEVSDWNELGEAIGEWISEDVVRKAVLFANGWTIILDPEMVMPDDDRLCSEVAAALGTEIVTTIYSADFVSGFFVFDPELRRAYETFQGTVKLDRGEPLPVETTMHLGRLNASDLLRFLASFGVDYSALENLHPFQIWELGEPAG